MSPDTKNIVHSNGHDLPDVWVIPAALRQLAEYGDVELLEELIAVFQTDTASRLELLRQAVAANDRPVIGAEAHTIKGSAAQVGANRVADFCHQLEVEVRKTPPVDLTLPLSRLLLSFDEVCRVIAARSPSELLP